MPPHVNAGGNEGLWLWRWVQLQVQRETSGNNCKQQKAFSAVIILMKVFAVITLAGSRRLSAALSLSVTLLGFRWQVASWRVKIAAIPEAANAHVSD